MKKTVQIAFAITLLILSVISTIREVQLINDIILAIIVPSFVLTLISFFNEIIVNCEEYLGAVAKSCGELSKQQLEEAKRIAASTKEKTQKQWEDFCAVLNHSEEIEKDSEGYYAARDFCTKCKNFLYYCNVLAYIFLFLSLILSPYFVKIFSDISLNSLTLWSLTVLYFSNELKAELCTKTFILTARHYLRKRKKEEQ